MSATYCGDPDVHPEHAHGNLEWCDGISEADVRESSLLVDLVEAEQQNTQVRPCQVCEVLEDVSEPVKAALKQALAGTIGRDKLVTILTNHGWTVGRRAVERHRQEGHS